MATERIPADDVELPGSDLASGDTIAQCAPGGGVTVWRSIPSAVVSVHHDPAIPGLSVALAVGDRPKPG
jgi:hypothetical protein